MTHSTISSFCALCLLAIATACEAASEPDAPVATIRSVQVGLEGYYKNGLWTPVDVHWECSPDADKGDYDVSISCTDSDGVPITYRDGRARPLYHPDGHPTYCVTSLYVKLGRKDAPLTVRVGDAEKKFHPSGDPAKQARPRTFEELWSTTRFFQPVPSERPLYLILGAAEGADDIGLQGAVAELSLREDRRPILVRMDAKSPMPDEWFGYEAIDMVVLTTTDPSRFDGMNAKNPAILALDRWIRLGGRLFFCAGRDAEPLLTERDGAAGPLTPFLPGTFTKMTELEQGTPLEVFVGSKRKIFMNGTPDAPFLKMPHFTEPRGIVLLRELDLPLVLRCAHGFGTIVYFGGDLTGRPLGPWRDRIALVRGVLQWNTERPTSGRGNVSLIQLGYNDLSGQVRSALDRFEGVRVVPFSVILLILATYWLVVGPVDWLLVHKVLKRPVLTWFSFPAWIVLFCVLAYALAASGRPNRVLLNELTLVDLDSETSSLRSSTWANLYSPADATYDLSFEPDMGAIATTLFSWNGLPGSGLGGMAPKTISPTVWQIGSEQRFVPLPNSGGAPSCLPKLDDVPIAVRSTKSFFGQSWSVLDFPGAMISGELADEESIPVGSLTVPETLPPLDDCVLVYDRWVQRLGPLEPGQTVRVNKTTPRHEMRDLLVPRDVRENDALQQLAAYNSQSTDLRYVATVLSLYGVLGGYEAVGLFNTFQRGLDLSDLFSVDRVILLGFVRDPDASGLGPQLSVDVDDVERRRTMMLRQSLPITLTELSPRLRLQKREIIGGALEDESKKTIQGPGEYKIKD